MAMSLAIIHSRALDGLSAAAVEVEVHLANGLPSFTLVGLADLEVKESRERVRAALQSSGLEFPANKRITVNLSPADLPKVTTRSIFARLRIEREAGEQFANYCGVTSSEFAKWPLLSRLAHDSVAAESGACLRRHLHWINRSTDAIGASRGDPGIHAFRFSRCRCLRR